MANATKVLALKGPHCGYCGAPAVKQVGGPYLVETHNPDCPAAGWGVKYVGTGAGRDDDPGGA